MTRSKSITTKLAVTTGAVVLLCLLLTATGAGQEPSLTVSGSRLSIDGGIFLGQRGDFRELYNAGPTVAVDFDRYTSTRFDYGASGLFRHLTGNNSNPLRYMELSFAPYATYTVSESLSIRPYVGAGAGVSYRRIKFEKPGDPFDDLSPAGQWRDDEWSGFLVLISGIDLPSFGPVMPGLRLTYNYHFTGNPTIGDFGNTGGFTLLARFGFRL